MFAGINDCIFETKPCLQVIIFAVGSGLINDLGTRIMFVGIYFCDLKIATNFRQVNPSLTLINLQ